MRKDSDLPSGFKPLSSTAQLHEMLQSGCLRV